MVQQDENLLIYHSTKQMRIAGSRFKEGMEASQDTSSLSMALWVLNAKASPGTVEFGWLGVLNGRKVATVFEDPSIQASNTEIDTAPHASETSTAPVSTMWLNRSWYSNRPSTTRTSTSTESTLAPA
ncbi:unnamed protein product [Ectocarpus sp. 13 AM-2016]